MRKTLREYCLEYGREDLLTEWHPEKNGAFSVDEISYGSQKRIWWKCAFGHEWESPLFGRTCQQHGCPYCAGKKIPEGMSFKEQYPELVNEWHEKKNAQLKPENFLPKSHVSVWWQCEKGHEWRATVKSRAEGGACPVCAGKAVQAGYNDLLTKYPKIAKEWDFEKNAPLKPSEILPKATKRVFWKCSFGHSWQAAVASRVNGDGCPVCEGKVLKPGLNDLETLAPEIAKEWDREKNGSLTPSDVPVYSNKNVWWKCEKGHGWKGRISSRTFDKSGCPYCGNKKVLPGFNDLATVEPKIAKEWHPTLNAPLEPSMVTVGSRKKVWWKCSLGHEWKAVIYSRAGAQKCGCPYCAGRRN